jgi:hypothetical protein
VLLQGGMLWAQMSPQQGNSNMLLGFDTHTHTSTKPVAMLEICQHMQVAYVGNETLLLCVQFLSNNLVVVDTVSAAAQLMPTPTL